MSHDLLQKAAPDFALQDQTGKTHRLSDYKGKWVIVYFYPKDMTPGCTTEACSFRDNEARLTSAGAVVLGISADSVKSHEKFAQAKSLNFPILSDPDKAVCKAYGSFGKKKFMGREYDGIFRNTYLINPSGVVVKVYESVKPVTHVEEILTELNVLRH